MYEKKDKLEQFYYTVEKSHIPVRSMISFETQDLKKKTDCNNYAFIEFILRNMIIIIIKDEKKKNIKN